MKVLQTQVCWPDEVLQTQLWFNCKSLQQGARHAIRHFCVLLISKTQKCVNVCKCHITRLSRLSRLTKLAWSYVLLLLGMNVSSFLNSKDLKKLQSATLTNAALQQTRNFSWLKPNAKFCALGLSGTRTELLF